MGHGNITEVEEVVLHVQARQHMIQTQAATSAPVYHVAQRFLHVVSSVASVLLGSGISILFGFSPLPSTSPVLGLAQQHELVAVFVVLILGILVLVSLVISSRLSRRPDGGPLVAALRFIASAVFSTLSSTVLCVLAGFNSLPSAVPLIGFIREHPPVGLGLIGLTLAALIFTPLLSINPEPNTPPPPSLTSRLYISTGVSVLCSILLITLLALVVARPPWCPSAICPPPEQIVVTAPNGVHDSNMEAYYTTTQSSTYLISGDPAQVNPGTMSQDVGAARIDTAYPPYRAVVSVHSLQRGTTFGIIVEQVAVLVDSVSDVPTPLNVAVVGSPLDYHRELYAVNLRLAAAQLNVPAQYQTAPGTQVHLAPGGSDELDVQINSQVATEVRFRVQVTYRVINESTFHTLVVPHEFDVVFSTGANWHPYHVDGGHLVPVS